MSRHAAVAFLSVCLLAAPVHADIALTITTDNDLTDGDDFSFAMDGSPHTLYIWGRSVPGVETIEEFNFDLSPSGSELVLSSAAIGSYFTAASWMTDTDLGDLQFGASKYLAGALAVPVSPNTLFATIDVSIDPGTTPGPDTTIDLGGGDFTMVGASGVTGTSRVLPEPTSASLLVLGSLLALRRR